MIDIKHTSTFYKLIFSYVFTGRCFSGVYQLLRTLYARRSQHAACSSFYLQQQLDSLNGSNSCFGDGSGNTTCQKVLHETNHRVRHGWMCPVQIWEPWLNQTSPRSSRKPNAPPSGRGLSICPNISTPFIARILSDWFTFWQTDKRGWINIRGWRLRRAPCWCPSRGRLKDTLWNVGKTFVLIEMNVEPSLFIYFYI